MIGIYDDAGDRLALGYSGLTFNDDAYPLAIVAVSHSYDAVTEPKATRNGMESYDPRQMLTMIRLEGVIKADSVAQLHDRIEAMNAAFDPVLSAEADTNSRNGYLPLTFSVPTADTTNYPSGLKPLQVYARSIALPVPRVSKFEGFSTRYTIQLQCVDPRRYLQTESTHSQTTLTKALDNTLATHRSWPIVTLTMSGAGPSNWYIDNVSINLAALRLNLSTMVNGDVVEVDMERRQIKKNGVIDHSPWISGEWFWLRALTQTIEVSSLSGISSCVVAWRRSFV